MIFSYNQQLYSILEIMITYSSTSKSLHLSSEEIYARVQGHSSDDLVSIHTHKMGEHTCLYCRLICDLKSTLY